MAVRRESTGGGSMGETLAFLHERITRRPRVLLILGSGLGALADELEESVRMAYDEIPGFPAAGVEGHAGRLVTGRLEGVECLAVQGRYHVYEGHSPAVAALPVRVAAALGAGMAVISNAAGALDSAFRPGEIMIIDDHINMTFRNPLAGPVLPGDERFPDMSEPYDRELQDLAQRVAAARGVRTVRGVYCGVAGPSYETRAEIRMLRRLGGDVVGMSTIPEVLVARALGVRVLGLSLITNFAAGLRPEPLRHEDVVAAGDAARGRFGRLVRGVLRELSRTPDDATA